MSFRHQDLGDALRHAPRLSQLELLLGYTDTRHELVGAALRICRHMVLPSMTAVRIRGMFDLGVDGKEHWEKHFLCAESDTCQSLHKLNNA